VENLSPPMSAEKVKLVDLPKKNLPWRSKIFNLQSFEQLDKIPFCCSNLLTYSQMMIKNYRNKIVFGSILNDYFVLSLCYTIQYLIEEFNNLSKSESGINIRQPYPEIS
jgi:hypothetical protein